MTQYRVKPWRGFSTGNVYYDVQRAGLLLWSKVITCFSEQEANEMITKLSCWDEGRPTSPVSRPVSNGEAK